MIYLYAITDHPRAALEGVRGHEDASVQLLARDGIAAAYSAHESLALEPSEEALWRHESVVEALTEDGAVLPVRFGAVVADEAALGKELARRSGEFRRALERVRGRVELALRVLWPEPGAATGVAEERGGDEGPGRAYLMRRLDQERRNAELADRVHEPLARLAVASERRIRAAPRPMLTAAYLVERASVPRFQERVARLREEHAELSVLCTGPWPPYSFATSRREDE